MAWQYPHQFPYHHQQQPPTSPPSSARSTPAQAHRSHSPTLLPQQRMDPLHSRSPTPRVHKPEPDYREPEHLTKRPGGAAFTPTTASPHASSVFYRFPVQDARAHDNAYETAAAPIRGRGAWVPAHVAVDRAQAIAAGRLAPQSSLMEYVAEVSGRKKGWCKGREGPAIPKPERTIQPLGLRTRSAASSRSQLGPGAAGASPELTSRLRRDRVSGSPLAGPSAAAARPRRPRAGEAHMMSGALPDLSPSVSQTRAARGVASRGEPAESSRRRGKRAEYLDADDDIPLGELKRTLLASKGKTPAAPRGPAVQRPRCPAAALSRKVSAASSSSASSAQSFVTARTSRKTSPETLVRARMPPSRIPVLAAGGEAEDALRVDSHFANTPERRSVERSLLRGARTVGISKRETGIPEDAAETRSRRSFSVRSVASVARGKLTARAEAAMRKVEGRAWWRRSKGEK